MGVAELVEQIDSEVAVLEGQAAALRNARNVLVSNGSVSPTAPGKPEAPSSRTSTGNGRRRGRPRGGGNRSEEAIKLVTEQPGISIPEMADRMGIQPNYLYRVMPKLSGEGKVKRDGQGWVPVS